MSVPYNPPCQSSSTSQGRFLPQLSPHTSPLLKILAHNTNNLSKLVWLILYYGSIQQTHSAIGLGYSTLIYFYIIRGAYLHLLL